MRLVVRHAGVTDGSTHLEFPTSFLWELISIFLCMKTKNHRKNFPTGLVSIILLSKDKIESKVV